MAHRENLRSHVVVEAKLEADGTWSEQERACEELFTRTTCRDKEGRFIVRIPMRENFGQLGSTYVTAEKRLRALRSRLQKDAILKEQYTAFMAEYKILGHMIDARDSDPLPRGQYHHLPQHAVMKESSTTTKLRFVFDASCKSDSGILLNEVQMVGPTVQQDLVTIMCRFRKHQFVMSADIEKMYRQILIAKDQRYLQCVLWDDGETKEIGTYILNTVTYGTASASFLATRCLKEIGVQSTRDYPEASRVIQEDFYMDDLLTGANTMEEANKIAQQVSALLTDYGFILRKWVANYAMILPEASNIPERQLGIEDHKALGISWMPQQDMLKYRVRIRKRIKVPKRAILSTIAQIFDLLGLLSPIIIKAKILMQRMWQMDLEWDEIVPPYIYSAWQIFIDKLPGIEDLRVPKCIFIQACIYWSLHGFCDSSEVVYGACFYVCSHNSQERTNRLVCSKTRVAPIKCLSLPRLELCGALLLAELMHKVKLSLNIPSCEEFYWTDSEIVLAWLGKPANTWKTFVTNRIARIQELTHVESWHHVPSKENPADLLSRVRMPTE
ncbi:uncharacterized protein [Prorops nasuta]|uniref:uncharacterized protein n=1 Tax=Prorops nasuta TaxID=863751 RepID=UPI0034CF1D17